MVPKRALRAWAERRAAELRALEAEHRGGELVQLFPDREERRAA